MYVIDYFGFYKEALVFLRLMLCTTVHFTLYRIMSGGKHRLMDTLFLNHCTEVRYASFLSGGFINVIVVNPPERRLAKRMQCVAYL